MNERDQALNRAKEWWEGKQDPKDSSYGTYVCDACSGPIFDKKGTSLVGGWMRCTKCTDKLFPIFKPSDPNAFAKGLLGSVGLKDDIFD